MTYEPRSQRDFLPILERIRRTWPIVPRQPDRIQFSLLQFGMVLTVFAVVFAIFGFYARGNFWEQRLAEKLEANGVRVRWHPGRQPRISGASLSRTRYSATYLRDIARLSRLEYLDFSGCPNDGDLLLISGHQRLSNVAFHRSTVSARGIKYLAFLPSLSSLSFNNCAMIDDQAGKELAKLNGLQQLTLSHCSISDTGILNLAKSKSLQVVRIETTEGMITEAGLDQLVKMKQLKLLEWNGKAFEGDELEEWRTRLTF